MLRLICAWNIFILLMNLCWRKYVKFDILNIYMVPFLRKQNIMFMWAFRGQNSEIILAVSWMSWGKWCGPFGACRVQVPTGLAPETEDQIQTEMSWLARWGWLVSCQTETDLRNCFIMLRIWVIALERGWRQCWLCPLRNVMSTALAGSAEDISGNISIGEKARVKVSLHFESLHHENPCKTTMQNLHRMQKVSLNVLLRFQG